MGVILNTPGAFRVITTDIMWPILFTMLFLISPKENVLRYIMKAILVGMWIVTIMDLCFIFVGYGLLPLPITIFTNLNFGYIFNSYHHEFTSTHMVSYLFCVPFLIGLLISDKNKRRFHNYVLLVMSLLIVLLSGRRGLLLVLLPMPFICYLLNKYLKGENWFGKNISKKGFFRILIVIITFIIGILIFNRLATQYLDFSIIKIIENFLEGFTFSDASSSAYIRGTQFFALMNGWLDSPIWGHGAGSYTVECIRSTEQLWAYELSYCALLFQKGILGFLIFCFMIIY